MLACQKTELLCRELKILNLKMRVENNFAIKDLEIQSAFDGT